MKNKMANVELIVRREFDDEGLVYATIRAKVPNDKRCLYYTSNFKKALIDGISEWVKNSPLGQKEFRASNNNYTLADLSLKIYPSLQVYLKKHGIYNLEVSSHIHDIELENEWKIDDSLVDEDTILECEEA